MESGVTLISSLARDQDRAPAPRSAAEDAFVVGGKLLHEEAVEPQRFIVRSGGMAPAPSPLAVDGAPHDVRATRVSPAAVDAEGSHGDPHDGRSTVLPGDPNRQGMHT
ncbi:hypothetical protein [Streptomyces longwoodensis]|uniref:hypothetical protein n=1 Tax=Streptomyces longwoodensis TaxID=68231 RepID=UPI0032464F47